jgi:DNA-binding beta-propeller fold protein YncE
LDEAGFLYVTNAGNHSVRVFAPGADGDEPPVRVIAGPSTGMSHPVGLARDDSGQIYVANYFNQTVTVFEAHASGDAAPVRRIVGPNTGIRGANWLAF